jgi:uncharacterized membrane protein SpoIIM required for sporulation
MKCAKCGSENVQAQVVVKKNSIVPPAMLAFGGIGLMFLGIIGAIIGVFLGWIVGVIIKSFMGELHETIFVCQDCGNSFSPNKTK